MRWGDQQHAKSASALGSPLDQCCGWHEVTIRIRYDILVNRCAARTTISPADADVLGGRVPSLPTEDAPFRDPQPTVQRIALLAQRVLAGDILLPKFQRDFVWTRQQVLDLLDSVARNYPIGSVLLWQSAQELASERTIAGLEVGSRRPGYPVNYLLDGQQRLSTICGALHWRPSADPDSLWNLAYDIEQQQFLHLTDFAEPPLPKIPVRLLADPFGYVERIASLDDPALTVRAKLLHERFQNYMVAIVTLGDMAIEDVGPVFERINRTGTRLDIVDLMRAATWTPDFDLRDSIDAVLAVLDAKAYGSIEQRVLLRAIAAAAGFGFTTEDIQLLRSITKAELRDAVGRTEQAARRAVDFPTTQIKTPTSAALPSQSVFAVLTEIFRQVEKPTSAQYAAIRRWFWRSVLGGYFRGWTRAQMTADITAINEFANGSAEISVAAGVPHNDIWWRTPFRVDSALAKMHALMLAYADPMDLRNGQHIDVGKALSWANDKEFHHVFPQAFLARQGVPADRINVPANIIMLTSVSNIAISDQRPSAYLRDITDWDGEAALQQRLASCIIDEPAYQAMLRDNYDAFVHARAATLHRHASTLAETGKFAEIGESQIVRPQ